MRLSYNLLPEVHDDAVNDELVEALRQGLEDVSRQRLRAILISFRRQANQENCLALKDLITILNENKVRPWLWWNFHFDFFFLSKHPLQIPL